MTMKKTAACLLSALVAAAGVSMGVSANEGAAYEAPYQSYTYDKWGNAVPAPNGYVPERSVRGSDLGHTDFRSPADLFYYEDGGEIYVADAGNNRIVVMTEDYEPVAELAVFDNNGEELTLNNPTGVFVRNDTVYIADQNNARIVVCDKEGTVSAVYGKPESTLIEEGFEYKPNKVVVDRFGKIYVQAVGAYEGLLCLSQDGGFINYYGSNKVEMTAKMMVQKIWKMFMTKGQRESMQNFVPIEYNNAFLDHEDFIYATAASSESNTNLITKLNPLGINIFQTKSSDTSPWYKNSNFSDITVDENDLITVVDTIRCMVYQCDENGVLMFAFGGRGSQLGLFQTPSAIEQVGDRLLVLDSTKNNITEFSLTSFGETVQAAIRLYNEGRYQEDIEPWQEVIKRNANYLLAYTGLGKAYYQLEEYEEAMAYFRLANDKQGYSDAYKEYSLEVMRANFGWIIGGIVLLLAAIAAVRRLLRRRRMKREGKSA